MEKLPLIAEVVEKSAGGWYLTLTNHFTQKTFECPDVEDFNEKMELLASLYPELEVSVEWLDSSHVRAEYINEVRQQLLAFDAKSRSN